MCLGFVCRAQAPVARMRMPRVLSQGFEEERAMILLHEVKQRRRLGASECEARGILRTDFSNALKVPVDCPAVQPLPQL